MHLRELGIGRHGDGRTKTALFLVLPDADTSFHFIAALLYSQVMETLLYEADHRFHGKLPIPVEFWMDEYANGARPWRFENLITTFRSRNMAAVLFVQSISQLKYIHKGDSWGILMDACSAVVFLGAGRGSLDSQEYISKLLGSGTIDKRSEGESRGKNGGSSLNFDRLGRELLTAAEVGSLDRDACLILLAGCGPVRDWKNKPFALPAFLEAQALPRYEHPVYVRRTSLGDFITLQPDGTLEELSSASVAYYRKRKEKGENIQFLTIDEDRFLQIDFLKETEIDLKTLSGYFLEHADDVVEAEKKALVEEEKDMSGSIFTCLDRYRKVLSESQIDAILSCLEAGLSQEMVKGCFFLPAERIQEEKRIALL